MANENSDSIVPMRFYTAGIEDDLAVVRKQLRNSSWSFVKNTTLAYIEDKERLVFFYSFLVIFLVAFFSNLYATYVTLKRKHRAIQKTFIVSLCLSDTIMAIAYTINYLESFSHPLIIWTIGPFLCKFIPWAQIFGLTASAAMLVAIAWDRYRNVVHATKKRWNPPLWKCITGVTLMWLTCIALTFPHYVFFELKRIMLIYMNANNVGVYREEKHLCITVQKVNLMIYNICVGVIIFLPLFILFFWMYYNIAQLVWTHRKPLSERFLKKKQRNEPSSRETSVSQLKSSEEISRSTSSVISVKPKTTQRSIHVERKIRTFKIIVCLMVVFFILRLPYWIFGIMKLTGTYAERKHWIMLYVFNGMALLNCAIDPFLYVFLNPTLSVLMKIKKAINNFVCEICCCCFSNTEFEEFENETENPFYGKNSIYQYGAPYAPYSISGKKYKVTIEEIGHGKFNRQDFYKDKKF